MPIAQEIGDAGSPSGRRAAVWIGLAIAGLAAAFALDASVARSAADLPQRILPAFRLITDLGTSAYILVIAAAVAGAALFAARPCADRRLRLGLCCIAQRAVYVFVAVAVSGIAAQVVKHIVGRARPKLIDTYGAFHFDLFAIAARNASFPSGHAATAFAAATAIGLVWPRGRPWLLAVATIVGLSRIVLRAHYPSDVLVGAALGVATAVSLAEILARRRIAFRPALGGIALRGRGVARHALPWRR